MDLMIHERRDEADGVVSLTLARADGGELPAWAPGAHVDVTLADDLVRQYSLCSDPGDRQRWRLGVLREPESRGGSEHVFDKLHDGDIVEVGEPRNHFALEPAPRYVFVAGGIGITPILPMIAAAEAAGAEWTLLYGGRTRTSMAFRDELAAHGDRVVLAPQDEVGLLDLGGQLMVPRPSTLVYACGPEPMLDALDTAMTAWPAGSLRVERFAPRAIATDGADEAFEVACASSGVTLVVPPDRSILEVAQERGLPVDFSCGEGTCGTCETPLLVGRAEHRDSLLTDEEKADQDTLFICVSRAERGCPRLELDL
ncbi:PDR/VanB family oxidoreductase [Actinomycetospora callitridis]|uniref:PDR/VanB family oxidoreductase n=1 Tax=Actinomycetospora callitridis TaxID=913944 RepID=UPI002365D23D|nr:PDR/VanB family oxidoreductase [Actinomycetospora callitridis]MDD7921481.1 PDR/VanB family oxidoreductase [Actinomycetospora callitridis]